MADCCGAYMVEFFTIRISSFLIDVLEPISAISETLTEPYNQECFKSRHKREGVAFYSDSNMTHGDLCSAKYIYVADCFLCYPVLRKER